MYGARRIHLFILWVRIILIDSSGKKISLSSNYGINNSFVTTMKSYNEIRSP